jgi:hypothetical protein
MSRVEASDGWTADGTVAGLQATVNGFFREQGMRVVGEQPGEVHARRRTSWLTRRLGRLAPCGWLPQRAVVKLRSEDGGVAVRASVEEEAAPGVLGQRLTAKYRGHFARWMNELKARLTTAGASAPRSPLPPVPGTAPGASRLPGNEPGDS